MALEEYSATTRASLREIQKKMGADHASSVHDIVAPMPPPRIAESSTLDRRQWLMTERLLTDLDEVTLDRKLGSGATGVVYMAVWHATHVAVKLVKNPLEIEDRALAERIVLDVWREILSLHALRHPNILPLLAVVYPGDLAPPKHSVPTITPPLKHPISCGLIFPLVPNGTLNVSRCSRDAAVYLRVACGVAQGMAHAHACNVIHRDLKPDNVMLGEGDVPLIADWGLSRACDFTAGGCLTGETGSYNWMAPEVLRYEQYGSSCDVYSFGILLWNLATGSIRPHPYLTPMQVARGVAKNGLRPEMPSRVTPEFRQLVEECWAENPVERPSFADICVRLEIIRADIRVHNHGYSLWGR